MDGPGGGTSDNFGSLGFRPFGLVVDFGESGAGVAASADAPSRNLIEGRMPEGVGVAGVCGATGGAILIAGVEGAGRGGGGAGAARA